MLLHQFCDQLHAELKSKLPDPMQVSAFSAAELSEVLTAIFHVLKEIRLFIGEHPFENQRQEIEFFKVIKPKFTSELLYYSALHQLLSKTPTDSLTRKKASLSAELEKCSGFFHDHQELYSYIRGGCTYMDHFWFLRLNTACPAIWFSDLSGLNMDHEFSTPQDHKVAAFLACERLCLYCEQQLQKLESGPLSILQKLPWTAKTVDLVELIYGLYLTGAIDHGRMSLVEICSVLEVIFDTKLDNHSYLFSQTLRFRKSGSVKFLPEMMKAIEQKLDELDIKGRVRRNRTQA
jgi:hypothetical protein